MICVSLQKMPFTEAVALLKSPMTEMAEIRLDLSDYGAREVSELCSLPVPVIATCRVDMAGEAKAAEQLEVAIDSGAAFVDMELEMPPALSENLLEKAGKAGCRVIRSYHCFGTTPDYYSLKNKVRECLAKGADIVKIAVMASCKEDSERVLSLYKDADLAAAGLEGRLVAFAMGEAGKESRIESLRLGAPFCYASVNGAPTAPGQPDVRTVCKELYGDALPCAGKGGLRLMDGGITIPQSKSTLQRRIIASALAGECYEVAPDDICEDVRAALAIAPVIAGKRKPKEICMKPSAEAHDENR